ncbi:hypothetical protein IWX92DRAFT_229894 [Phyllosticta citricarpa]
MSPDSVETQQAVTTVRDDGKLLGVVTPNSWHFRAGTFSPGRRSQNSFLPRPFFQSFVKAGVARPAARSADLWAVSTMARARVLLRRGFGVFCCSAVVLKVFLVWRKWVVVDCCYLSHLAESPATFFAAAAAAQLHRHKIPIHTHPLLICLLVVD